MMDVRNCILEFSVSNRKSTIEIRGQIKYLGRIIFYLLVRKMYNKLNIPSTSSSNVCSIGIGKSLKEYIDLT